MALDSFAGTADRVRLGHRTLWHLFLGSVTVATFLPFAAVPLAREVVPNAWPLQYLVVLLNMLGATFHVAATGWFYSDSQMRGFFRSRPVRYFIVPAVLVIGSAVTFQFLDRSLCNYLVAAYFCWQLWHYQKQNVGLLSFVAAGTDGVPMSKWERVTLEIAAVGGILGFFQFNDAGLPGLAPEFSHMHVAGLVVYCLLPIPFLIAVVKNPTMLRNPLRLLFFLLGTLFFLPTFLFSDPLAAVLGYALGHGLQYLVFMGFVAGKQKPLVSLATLLGIAAVGSFFLNRGMVARDWLDFPYAYGVYGAFLGVVMSHFVLDAGIWRLREPFQRGYMRDKFAFVFNRRRNDAS